MLWNVKVTIVTIVIDLGTITKKPGGHGSWRTGRDYPNDSIAENSQSPETSPGDLRRFVFTQTPVKKTSTNADVKNPNELIIIIIIIIICISFF